MKYLSNKIKSNIKYIPSIRLERIHFKEHGILTGFTGFTGFTGY